MQRARSGTLAERMPFARIGALQRNDESIGAWAAHALGKAGDRRAVPRLRHELKSSVREMGTAAAQALGMIGDPSALPALREALKIEKEVGWAIKSAIEKIERGERKK